MDCYYAIISVEAITPSGSLMNEFYRGVLGST